MRLIIALNKLLIAIVILPLKLAAASVGFVCCVAFRAAQWGWTFYDDLWD